MSEQSTVAGDPSVAVTRYPRAYARMTPAMRALPAETLQQVNVHIPYAVTSVLGALPELMALRPRIVDEMPKFPIEMLDNLEDATLAMGHADTVYTVSTRKPEGVPVLAERAARACAIFRADLQTLALREIIDGAPLEQLRGGPGHRNIAFDLFALTYLVRANWAAIQGKTALTLAEITEAEQLADQLTTALGLRQQAPTSDVPSADMRVRAFNLFMRHYDEVERAVRFLHPKTYQDILPSVHTPRGPGKKRAEEERSAPSSTGVHPAVQDAVKANAEAEEEAAPIAVGMPGASPYTKA